MNSVSNGTAQLAQARADVYGLLAVVFRSEPSSAFLASLQSAGVWQSLQDLGFEATDIPCTSLDQLAEDLAVEFTSLFIGPGPHISPHESVYAEGGPRPSLWGAETVEVKRFMEATGLSIDYGFSFMPDHVSAEFELMQRLAETEAESERDGNREHVEFIQSIQRRFYDEHLSRWVPRLCDDIVKGDRSGYYRAFARLAGDFLADERSHLATPATPPHH